MRTKIIEAVSDAGNHGKFMVCRFDEQEYGRKDIAGFSLVIPRWGHGKNGHLLVVDLETGEGAFFRPGGHAKADVHKRRIWVCVLFEAFLAWLYEQDPDHWVHPEQLPDTVELTGIPLQMRGYRRAGASGDLIEELAQRFEQVSHFDDYERARLAVELLEERIRQRLLASEPSTPSKTA